MTPAKQKAMETFLQWDQCQDGYLMILSLYYMPPCQSNEFVSFYEKLKPYLGLVMAHKHDPIDLARLVRQAYPEV